MTTSFSNISSPARITRARLFSVLSLLVAFCALGSLASAQTPTDPNAANNNNANGNGNGRQRRNQNGGNFDPAQMQQQMMDRMRDALGVTDDAEWKIITDRVTAVTELRRAAGGGAGGMMGMFRGGQNNNNQQGNGGGGRRGNASPEQDALRQAVQDKLPDAEIKARLDRFREVRKSNEEKLAKAQEDLRAVLNVRQEAVAVMFGLLP